MMRRSLIFKVSLVTLAALIMVGTVCATAQERPQVPPKTPESGHWFMGEWVGIHDTTVWLEEATIRITSYDTATHTFKGDGTLLADPRSQAISPTRDLVIEVVIDDEGKVVMTIHKEGGGSSSFNLKRKGDNKLYGTTAYGPPSLSLEKKR